MTFKKNKLSLLERQAISDLKIENGTNANLSCAVSLSNQITLWNQYFLL